MISGAHFVVFSKDADADRRFFRDVLGFASVDAGHGWLIFRMPPAEAAFHPSEENNRHELYFLCEDLAREISELREKGVSCTPVKEERWGSLTSSIPNRISERDHADIKLHKRTTGYKGHDPRFRPWPAQLGQDIGIE